MIQIKDVMIIVIYIKRKLFFIFFHEISENIHTNKGP